MKANKYLGKYLGTLGTSSLDRIRGAELLRTIRKFSSRIRLWYLLHSSKFSEHSSPWRDFDSTNMACLLLIKLWYNPYFLWNLRLPRYSLSHVLLQGPRQENKPRSAVEFKQWLPKRARSRFFRRRVSSFGGMFSTTSYPPRSGCKPGCSPRLLKNVASLKEWILKITKLLTSDIFYHS